MKGQYYLIVLLFSLLLIGCGNTAQKDFNQALEIAVRNDDVKEAQWKNLLEKLDAARMSGVTLTQKVSTKEDLIRYIWDNYPNINGSVSDLVRKVVKIDSLKIYLENSHSMTGYFPKGGNLSFAEPIIDMYNLGQENTVVNTFYVGDKMISVDPIQFRKDLSDGKVAEGGSSPLADIFGEIIENTGDYQVSCLITDAIMSGSNSDIAKNKEYNYIHRPELRQTIRETFQKAKRKGLSVLVYRFESSFNGIYYDYRNTRSKIEVGRRPFFIFVLGKLENLNIIAENAKKELAFNPTHQMLIGQDINTVTSFKFKPAKGPEYIPNQTRQSISYKNQPTRVAELHLRVDLSGLPSYMRNEKYLSSNLNLSTIDHSTKKPIDCNEYIDSVEELNAATGEYQINLFLPKEYLSTIPNTLTVTLKSEPNIWYKSLSLEKDDADNFDENKTFALDYMVEGMLMGLDEMQLPNAIDMSIKIER
ncbi:MAG: hypothetical protein E6767_06270 [Dysgonomonas sp.]|nr:hypothetical protein [Dysgonomonas sp.]